MSETGYERARRECAKELQVLLDRYECAHGVEPELRDLVTTWSKRSEADAPNGTVTSEEALLDSPETARRINNAHAAGWDAGYQLGRAHGAAENCSGAEV